MTASAPDDGRGGSAPPSPVREAYGSLEADPGGAPPRCDIEDWASQFLKSTAPAPVFIFSGFVSAWGLDWLGRRTPGRKCGVLVGRMDDWRWRSGEDSVREGALRFLRRNDVDVRYWAPPLGKTGGVVHLKAWVSGDTMFTGSANLTRNGLRSNYETMVEPAERFAALLSPSLTALWEGGVSVNTRLISEISEDGGHLVPRWRPPAPRVADAERPRPAPVRALPGGRRRRKRRGRR